LSLNVRTRKKKRKTDHKLIPDLIDFVRQVKIGQSVEEVEAVSGSFAQFSKLPLVPVHLADGTALAVHVGEQRAAGLITKK